ncbi:MAG: FHA domain-containing protein [Limisphaerales bacterium]
MSQRVKHCGCGQANAEHDAFCARCGQPIFDVVAVATEPPKPEVEAEPTPAAAAPAVAVSAKKVCPLCGTVNEFFALLCGGAGCGNDLSAVVPSGGAPAAERAQAQSAATPASPALPGLLLSVGAQNFECRDGDTIGREGSVGCQIFSGIGTVSRRHVSFTQCDGQWFVTALAGVQNITQLDGRELPRGAPQPLTGEHTLKMSTQCEVRLKVGNGG